MVKKTLAKVLLLAFMLTTSIPAAAFGYSYGNAEQEPVAESYKKIVAALNSGNWKTVDSEFKAFKTELTKEFGAGQVKLTEAAIKAKQKNLVLTDYNNYLAQNVKRRLKSAAESLKDYKKAKMMLNKASATYAALETTVKAKKASTHTAVMTAFDNATDAIGNPGLFGVGAKPANNKAFEAASNTINKSLLAMFPARKVPVQKAPVKGSKPSR